MARKRPDQYNTEEAMRTSTMNPETGLYENTGSGTEQNRNELAAQQNMIATRDKMRSEGKTMVAGDIPRSQKGHGISSWFSRSK